MPQINVFSLPFFLLSRNLCKHISIQTINKICYVEATFLKAITKQTVNTATELKLIQITNIKYIHHKANPVSGIKFIILDELSSIHSAKKHIPLIPIKTKKKIRISCIL